MATVTSARRIAHDRSEPALLLQEFADWFDARGWAPHRHQIDMLAAAQDGDSALLIAPTGGGKTVDTLDVGPLTLRHEAAAETLPSGEVSGHFHPKAVVRTRGRRISGRCFVTDGRRVILPASARLPGA